jgi:Tfp pilus assembly protein PilF
MGRAMRFLQLSIVLLMALENGSSAAQSLGGHEISGVVREEASNALIPAVSLQILTSGSQARPSITSGIRGEFTFRNLRDGEYSIVATKDGYDTATVTVTVMRSGTVPVSISLRRNAAAKPIELNQSISMRQLKVPEKARAAYEKGRGLLEEEGKPAESIPEFQRAIHAFPSYYEAYSKLGIANYQTGKSPEAEQALKKAIDLSSGKLLEPLYLLADLYNGQRKYQDSELLARQAIALDDSSWNAHFELARAMVALKRGADAEASALRARELQPSKAPVYLVLANAHLLEQNYRAAIQDFDTYLNLEPNGPVSDAVRQRRERLQKDLPQVPDTKEPPRPSVVLQQP